MYHKQVKVFSGNSNPVLATDVCAVLGIPLGKALVGQFSDGEVRVEIHENVRGKDVYVIQSTCSPVNQNLMELLLMIDALKRASAKKVNAVIPYYGYGRQDQKDKPRVSITAKLIADLLSAAGVDRMISIDLHAEQIQGFFKIPVDNLSAMKVLFDDLKHDLQGGEVIVAPDAGGVKRAREFAKKVHADLAIMDHRDITCDQPSGIVGDVKGRSVILLDDMVDTGRTLIRAAEAAHRAGASTVDALCVHGVLSGDAVDRLERSPIRFLIITDTIPAPDRALQGTKIRVASIAPMMAEIICRVHDNKSVSTMFV